MSAGSGSRESANAPISWHTKHESMSGNCSVLTELDLGFVKATGLEYLRILESGRHSYIIVTGVQLLVILRLLFFKIQNLFLLCL